MFGTWVVVDAVVGVLFCIRQCCSFSLSLLVLNVVERVTENTPKGKI